MHCRLGRREALQPADVAAFEAFLCGQLAAGAGAAAAPAAVLSSAHALSITHAWLHAMRGSSAAAGAGCHPEPPELAQRAESACLAALAEYGAAPGGSSGSGSGLGSGSGSQPASPPPAAEHAADPGKAGKAAKAKPGAKAGSPSARPSLEASAATGPGTGSSAGSAAEGAALAGARLLQLLLARGWCTAQAAAPAAWGAFWASCLCAPGTCPGAGLPTLAQQHACNAACAPAVMRSLAEQKQWVVNSITRLCRLMLSQCC